MSSFFSSDNAVIGFLSRLGDLIILNILFLICSIPIFTIGASTTALYYTSMKSITLEEGYVARRFFKSFKQNFKQSTIIWLLSLLLGAFLILNLYIAIKCEIKVYIVIFTIISCLLVFIMTYIFQLQAKFDNPIKVTIRNAFLLSIKYFPWTLLLIVIFAAVCYLFYLSPIVDAVMLLIGFSLYAYGTSFIYNKLFAPYLPEERDIHDEEYRPEESEESEESEEPEE